MPLFICIFSKLSKCTIAIFRFGCYRICRPQKWKELQGNLTTSIVEHSLHEKKNCLTSHGSGVYHCWKIGMKNLGEHAFFNTISWEKSNVATAVWIQPLWFRLLSYNFYSSINTPFRTTALPLQKPAAEFSICHCHFLESYICESATPKWKNTEVDL